CGYTYRQHIELSGNGKHEPISTDSPGATDHSRPPPPDRAIDCGLAHRLLGLGVPRGCTLAISPAVLLDSISALDSLDGKRGSVRGLDNRGRCNRPAPRSHAADGCADSGFDLRPQRACDYFTDAYSYPTSFARRIGPSRGRNRVCEGSRCWLPFSDSSLL